MGTDSKATKRLKRKAKHQSLATKPGSETKLMLENTRRVVSSCMQIVMNHALSAEQGLECALQLTANIGAQLHKTMDELGDRMGSALKGYAEQVDAREAKEKGPSLEAIKEALAEKAADQLEVGVREAGREQSGPTATV